MRCAAFIMVMLWGQWASAQQQRPPLAQGDEPDRYLLVTQAPTVIMITNADSSLIGSINMKGDTIIPLRYYSFYSPTLGTPIHDGLIFLYDTARTPFPPGYIAGISAVTRNGIVLYHPFLFDNGPDYWQEGHQRFVAGNRMGFVNRFGVVTAPAKYPFVTPYRNGYAWACLDCVWTVFDSTDEHSRGFKGTLWERIDKHGKVVVAKHAPGGRITFPSPEEDTLRPLNPLQARLAAILRRLPDVKNFIQSIPGTRAKDLVVMLCDEPFPHSPYYHFRYGIKGEDFDIDNDYQFLISSNGKTILHISGDLQRVQTLRAWRAERRPSFSK